MPPRTPPPPKPLTPRCAAAGDQGHRLKRTMGGSEIRRCDQEHTPITNAGDSGHLPRRLRSSASSAPVSWMPPMISKA